MIKQLKDLLEALNSVGIEEIVIDPTETGSRVRGSNKDRNIIVFDDIEDKFCEDTIAVQSVKALLSRIQLFEGDFDKTKMQFNNPNNAEHVHSIKVCKGRRSVSYQCASPDRLAVPKIVPQEENSASFTFDKEYATYIAQAITSISYTGEKSNQTPHSLSLSVDESVATLAIFDGEFDSFTDTFDVTVEKVSKHTWEVTPFQRVMKKAVDTCGVVRLNVTEKHGIAIFDLSHVFVMVTPMA